MRMGRTRRSARGAGTNFESCVAAFLRVAVGDERIERRARSGAKDRGDVSGAMVHGRRVVIECKDHAGREEMGAWLREAEAERGNDDAHVGVVVSKARGVLADRRDLMKMAGQRATMTLLDLAVLLNGSREEVIENVDRYGESRAAFDGMMGDPLGELDEMIGGTRHG